MLVQQQDEEYQRALAEDKRKEREAEELKAKQELEEVLRISMEEEKQRILEQKARNLPPEPPAAAGATTIALRLPDGSRQQRRFSPDSKFQVVLDWLGMCVARSLTIAELLPDVCKIEGMSSSDVTLSTNFPKRELNDPEQTLEGYGLHPQGLIFVQHK